MFSLCRAQPKVSKNFRASERRGQTCFHYAERSQFYPKPGIQPIAQGAGQGFQKSEKSDKSVINKIRTLFLVTEIQGHGEGELVAGAFINKPIRSGMVVLD